jgi:hypothetical protein
MISEFFENLVGIFNPLGKLDGSILTNAQSTSPTFPINLPFIFDIFYWDQFGITFFRAKDTSEFSFMKLI